MRNLFAEILWLGGAAAFTFFFWKTFLAIQAASLVATIALRSVERSFR